MIRRLTAVADADLDGLADVLLDCVAGGASVSFLQPLTRERAREFWAGVAAGVARGERVLLVADDEHGVAGTVQLGLALPENQPHRADLAKMLVHRRARQQGLGAELLAAAEDAARELGRTLLVLDTANAAAERLYVKAGWQRVGRIPRYALTPAGQEEPTVVYYRDLS